MKEREAMARTNGPRSESKRSLTLQRSKGDRAPDSRLPGQNARSAQEDPREGGEGQKRGSHPAAAPVPHNGDEPYGPINAVSETENALVRTGDVVEAPGNGQAEVTHYRGIGLKDIGYGKDGKVVQHTYSAKTAKQISAWIAGGYDSNAICIRLNMRPGKLKQLYGKEIAIGLELVGMEITESIVTRAKKSDRLAVFFAKAKLGWRDGDGPVKDASLLNINIHL